MNAKFFLFIPVAFGIMFSADAFAANKRCGLGSKLFGGSKGILSQLTENTTNQTAGGAYSISFGTSGCKNNGELLFHPLGQNDDQKKIEKQVHYANANFEELTVEMAAGKGEALTGFAQSFGCHDDGIGVFGSTTRANYTKIIGNDEVAPEEMLRNVRETIRTNPTLLAQCDAA